MAKHARPIVVRLWPTGYHEASINAYVHDWNDGRFTLPADHPLAQTLWGQVHKREFVLTAFDTKELEWHVNTVLTGTHEHRGRFVISCAPRHEVLRRCLAMDDVLIERGLVV